LPWKQRLYSLAFTAGVVGAAASVLGGIGSALLHERTLPPLELGPAFRVKTLLAAGAVDDALRELELASSIAFGDPALLRSYLEVADASDDPGARAAALAHWVRLQPRDPERRSQLLEALMSGVERAQRSGQVDARAVEEAVTQAEALVALEADELRSHSWLGLALLQRNLLSGHRRDAVRAASHLEHAIALGAPGAAPARALAIARARARGAGSAP